METDGKAENTGVRMGHRVTIKKLEKVLPDGTKERTHPRYLWRATYVEGGKRKQKYFTTKPRAEKWANEHEKDAALHGTDATITPSERATVIDTRTSLQEINMSLRDAVTFALEYQQKARKSCTMSEMAADALATRERSGISDRHISDMRSKLRRFAKTFGSRSVATITKQEIEAWLHTLKLAPASINAYRRILVVAFNDAKRNGHLEQNPAELVRQAKVVEKEVGILSPKEAAKLLVGADKEILPAVALGLFAGMRLAELERIDWSEISLDVGSIRIIGAKAKSARSRLIPISDNLANWLKDHAKRQGSVWPESHQHGRELMEAAHLTAGFGTKQQVEDAKAKGKELLNWPKNGLRHSYATYHLAFHENASALALYMGHTNTQLIFAHYRLPVLKEVATEYWSILPSNAEAIAKGETVRQ